jgi:putative ABC transport system permease protein
MFVILLTVYIQHEESYDQFHTNKDRVFRLTHDGPQSNIAAPSGPLLMDNIPEIEAFTRLYDQEGFACANSVDKFRMEYLLVDSSFFTMFSFNLIAGSPQEALKKKNSIVLTETYALKLFGKMPQLGEVVNVDGKFDFTITGIMKDLPSNTHIKQADAIVDFASLAKLWDYAEVLTSYNSNTYGLYVMKKQHADLASREEDISKLFYDVNWMFKRGIAKKVHFEPLTDVYFSDTYSVSIKQNSKKQLYTLSGIVIAILVLSVLNYINLTIAQSGKRSKEIAIKKLMGSKKQAIFYQYIAESAAITLISLVLAFSLSLSMQDAFGYFLHTHMDIVSHLTFQSVLLFFAAVCIIAIVSGIIPAITISGFNPIDVVKGTFQLKNKNTYSKGLIIFQYLIIVVLMVSAICINKQTRFMQRYDLGYNKDNILIIDEIDKVNNPNGFKPILESLSAVEHVCYVAGNPIDGGNNRTVEYNHKNISFQVFKVDTSYFNMMGINIIPTGTAYSPDAIILNETAVKEMGLPPLPKSAKLYKEFPVYGVVKDFHFKDLKEQVGATFFSIAKPDTETWSIMIKVTNPNAIHQIKAAWEKYTHGVPLKMNFMDDSINQWYEQEVRMGKLVNYFTFLTIVISVMGLFAMSLFYVQQKTKEVGVRKVNGATIAEILILLNKDFIKWVAIAFVIACPIAYYAMNKWLENFAYKTELSWWVFALAGTSALVIALITVSWQSWRAATRNPVEALRYE